MIFVLYKACQRVLEDTNICQRELSQRYAQKCKEQIGGAELFLLGLEGNTQLGILWRVTLKLFGIAKHFKLQELCSTMAKERSLPAWVVMLSHRVGLLPDKMGKESLPKPSEKVESFTKSYAKKHTPLCGENWNSRPWGKEE